ncbi:hypothetical protein ACWDTR_09405 [Streptomyces sp. NPDC003470]|uniref:hypothetical protein n=1 Tax=unclassified Streptomyces TaxID=2593676 RepID=UPI003656761E
MLHDADDLPDVLLDPAVPYEDVNPLIALHGSVTRDPGATRLLLAAALNRRRPGVHSVG